MTRGDLFADQVETWFGVPYREQARVRAGCDCKGLIAGAAAELGFPEARSVEALAADYGAVIPVTRLRRGLARIFDRVGEMRRGDVLLVLTGGKAQHLAVFDPRPGFGGIRVVEAMHRPPAVVRPFRRFAEDIDSIWRWRPIDGADHG